MQNPLLKIENLHVTYTTDESCVYAVNGLDLELFAGETLGLVGETGAGKTTTALSVMQLLPEKIGKVTEGSILLDGVDVLAATDADMRLLRGSTVSMIFQDPYDKPKSHHPRWGSDRRGAPAPQKKDQPCGAQPGG